MKRKTRKYLSKGALYKNAILPSAIGYILFVIIILVVFQIVYFLGDRTINLLESLMINIGMVMFLYLLIIGIISLNPIQGVMRLSRQEKALNFSFADETRKQNINSPVHESYQWFIYTNDTTVLVFNRDYIKEIKEIKNPNNRRHRLIMTIITVDDKKMKIEGLTRNIKKLEEWLSASKCVGFN